ncbi:hypothetical protein AB0K71_05810 [Streptomyces syringium]|uniref:hypothetical protein n=1 Tax=Streptomyces syringium TaxID=76729 RepID=UPI00343EB163
MIFDVYWPGRPRRWFASLAAVTVLLNRALATEAEMALKALAASRGAVGAVSPGREAAGVLLLEQPARPSAARAATVEMRVRFMPRDAATQTASSASILP